MDQHVTLRDIARVTNVHFTTVGLALRNDPRVKAATALRVQEMARKLGYTQDAMLSALSAYRRGKPRRFAGVLAFLTFYPPETLKTNITARVLLESVTAYARSQGFGLESFRVNSPTMTGARMTRMLRARGIQGVMLTHRLPSPGPMFDLDWQYFSTVAVGYSITDLNVHRACPHHAHNMRLCLQKLRERGYRRIGFVLQTGLFERTRGILLGSYLAEQWKVPDRDRITPLVIEEVTKAILAKWLTDQRIDCVILSGYAIEIQQWIEELDYRIPDEMGVCVISRFSRTEGMAGIDEQLDLLGEAAGSFLVSLLQHNERGLPFYPRYTLVEGRWIDRPTVRMLS
jgi:LacI family transcriptional regulator